MTSQKEHLPLDFPPSLRLHFPWEYRAFFNNSKAIRLSQCIIFRVPNERGHVRVGITVKAQPRCNSVERNGVKRQVREFFRIHQRELGSFDYNVVVTGARSLSYPFPKVLRECLENEFHRFAVRTASPSSL